MSAATLQALAVVCELTGAQWSKPAMMAAERALDHYPERDVLAALDACTRELSGRVSLAEILERVEQQDGRPTPEEAWALAVRGVDEWESIVWNEEIASAWNTAHHSWAHGNRVGARIAFLSQYERLVAQARRERSPVRWFPSLGFDQTRREKAIHDAIAAGQLTNEHARALGISPPPTQPLLEKK